MTSIPSLDENTDLADDIRLGPPTSFNMEVPEKIVVSVGETGNVKYDKGLNNHTRESLNTLGSRAIDPVALKTPPRILTVNDRNWDIGDDYFYNDTLEADNIEAPGLRSTQDGHLDQSILSEIPGPVDDVTLLRRQVFKLHRRITNLERIHNAKQRQDKYMYTITAILCIINGWFLYKNRNWL